MIINELLRDDYSLKEAMRLQMKYVEILIEKEISEGDEQVNSSNIKLVVGVDISYHKIKNEENGVACAVLWDYENNSLKEIKYATGKICFPYVAGSLGFRECKLLAAAVIKLSKRPDLIICDGHGKAHPRGFGEATHLGLALNIPSIGVAKNFFWGYSNWKNMERKKGNKVPIYANEPFSGIKNDSMIIGYAICLNHRMKPVFLSVGYNFSLDDALNVVLKLTENHRQPEPLYLADKFSREKVKEWG
ncbi:MAG: endonuclease V [Promethearchaeota archaeon]